jgi:hypothetical protein
MVGAKSTPTITSATGRCWIASATGASRPPRYRGRRPAQTASNSKQPKTARKSSTICTRSLQKNGTNYATHDDGTRGSSTKHDRCRDRDVQNVAVEDFPAQCTLCKRILCKRCLAGHCITINSGTRDDGLYRSRLRCESCSYRFTIYQHSLIRYAQHIERNDPDSIIWV